jgi:hypothetical protein
MMIINEPELVEVTVRKAVEARLPDWERKTPFPENGMTVGFALPGFCRPVHTAGTHVRRGAGFNEVLKGCH